MGAHHLELWAALDLIWRMCEGAGTRSGQGEPRGYGLKQTEGGQGKNGGELGSVAHAVFVEAGCCMAEHVGLLEQVVQPGFSSLLGHSRR